jgi:arginase
MKKKIKFLGVSSGICAPAARGKLGAELGFNAIRKYAGAQKTKIFKKANIKEIVSLKDLYDYIEHPKYTTDFFNDLRPPTIKGLPRKIYEIIFANREKILIDIKLGKKNPFAFLYKFIKKNRKKISHDGLVFPHSRNVSRHIKYLYKIFEKIIFNIKETLINGEIPFVIAGDHSTAAATIAGIKQYLAENKHGERLGVVWIDAHVDGHCPYSTPSGNYHGMPIGIALGLTKNYAKSAKDNFLTIENKKEWEKLCSIHGSNEPMLKKEELVYIGIRSWEPHEEALLDDIRHFKLTRTDERKSGGSGLRPGEKWGVFNGKADKYHMKNKSLKNVCDETIAYLKNNGCSYIYISFDIDSIEDSIVPGTGTPEPFGLGLDEVKFMLKRFWENKEVPLIGMELVEVNPLLDENNSTVKTAFEIIKSIVDNNNEHNKSQQGKAATR